MDLGNRPSIESSTSSSEEESVDDLTPASILEGSSDPNGPRKKDVLLGRGKPFQNFSGNRRMLRIVSQFKSQYAAKPRDQKRLYVETALEAVLKDGARFLRRVETAEGSHKWEEVDRAAAAEKVWHVLRSKGEARSKKIRHTSEPGDDHVQLDYPLPSTFPTAGNTAESTTGSNFHYQQPPVIQSTTPIQHMSLVQSLSNALLQHLSNATAAAALLAAISNGPIQAPTPLPVPTAENASMNASQDQSAATVAQLLMGQLLRAQVEGSTLNRLSALHHLAYNNAASSNSSNPAAAALQSPLTVAPPTAAANPPGSLGGESQQNQLIQIISSLLQVAGQFNPTQEAQRQPPAPPSQPPNFSRPQP
jgi:hypothetical protein